MKTVFDNFIKKKSTNFLKLFNIVYKNNLYHIKKQYYMFVL